MVIAVCANMDRPSLKSNKALAFSINSILGHSNNDNAEPPASSPSSSSLIAPATMVLAPIPTFPSTTAMPGCHTMRIVQQNVDIPDRALSPRCIVWTPVSSSVQQPPTLAPWTSELQRRFWSERLAGMLYCSLISGTGGTECTSQRVGKIPRSQRVSQH
jgi:hypothetical protein